MYFTHSRKAKPAIRWLAASCAHMGKFNFQPDATRKTPLSAHNHLFQEVTMLLVPTPKEKAAVATAAPGALTSAPTSNSILPLLQQNETGLCSFLPTIPPSNPFRHVKATLRPLRI